MPVYPSRRGLLRGAVGVSTALAISATTATARATADTGPSATLIGSSLLDARALYFVSYNGLVNNNSFQKNGLLTHQGYQYAVWYTADRNAVVARRPVGSSAWSVCRIGHTLSTNDSHNVISAGVSPSDGRLHLVMDSHSSRYFYVKSVAGLMSSPASHPWSSAQFGPVQTSMDGVALTSTFTYPQFIVSPAGRLQLSYRTGVSGNGQAALAEYNGSSWANLGNWSSNTGIYTSTHGSSSRRNLYLHGLDYGRDGTLHVFGTWREQSSSVMCSSGGLTNHDTVYVSSTDNGRTWRNSAGAVVGRTGSSPVSVTSAGLVVDALSPDHALMNQESQAVDSAGLPHALISYVPGRFAQCVTDYVSGRVANARPFHVWKDASGGWHKTEIPVALGSSQRSQLVLDAYDNAYAVMPYGRIVAASAGSKWTDWTMIYDGRNSLRAFGEVVVDHTRISQDGVLSFMYQEKSSGSTAPSPLRVIDFRLP
ncbi:BNR repeat-containing protein [Streptomyces sp. Li-HN-5-11]|uniref:BNR repeat-containing protein n=1 Tax=Streptomyces sp. Li-HN-5-11 TaxID=3075432 RepID=UPI0028B12CF5|nr:BNR repeat-containing protein [Streptomyces sp. Li-HN-5-11]WNM31925.1 BNR repeat-containing protein [Streptomyces sp. Li-HN-5-11]